MYQIKKLVAVVQSNTFGRFQNPQYVLLHSMEQSQLLFNPKIQKQLH